MEVEQARCLARLESGAHRERCGDQDLRLPPMKKDLRDRLKLMAANDDERVKGRGSLSDNAAMAKIVLELLKRIEVLETEPGLAPVPPAKR